MGTVPLVSFNSSLQETPTASCLLGCDQPPPFPTLPYTSPAGPGLQPGPRLSPSVPMRVKRAQRFMASHGLPRSGQVGSNWKQSWSLVQVSLARTAMGETVIGGYGREAIFKLAFIRTDLEKEIWELPLMWVTERKGPAKSMPCCLFSGPKTLRSHHDISPPLCDIGFSCCPLLSL